MFTKQELSHIFTSYIHQVIHNTALSYFKKEFRYQNKTLLCLSIHDYLIPYDRNTHILENLTAEKTNEIELYIKDDYLSQALETLTQKEKIFIFEKYVLCKTDLEISTELGISRQGASILKKRILAKLYHYLKRP